MFEYFPGNYVWNLSVVGALNSGGQIDEIDRACRPLLGAAKAGSDAGTNEFLRVWTDLTDALVESAQMLNLTIRQPAAACNSREATSRG